MEGVNSSSLQTYLQLKSVGHGLYRSNELVSWSIASIFSTNIAISETKSQGWRAIPTHWRKASDILTSTLAAFLFSSHPKRERDQKVHLPARHCNAKGLIFYRFSFSFFLFWRLISEVPERISTKLGCIFTYDCYLKNLVQTPSGIYPHGLGRGQKRFFGTDFEFWLNISLQRNMISAIRKKFVNLQGLPKMPHKYAKHKHAPLIKIHITQNQHKETKTRLRRLLQHSAWKWSGTILVEWEWMEKQENRWSE